MELMDNHLFSLISKYDGEKYASDEYTLEEARNSEKIKRKKLQDKGYDVENYDKIHNQLTQEYLTEYRKMKNTFERATLYEKYEQKKKDLAKKFFDIDLDYVVMY